MAKDFSKINTGRVNSMIEQATGKKGQQGTASAEEVKQRQSKLKTQGRKGAKAIRINMAFTPENHHFIKVYASSTGQTMTEACNQMLDYARTDKKFIQIAQKQLESLLLDIASYEKKATGKSVQEVLDGDKNTSDE